MIPASQLPLAAGTCFTQPRDHSLADPCKSRSRRPISPAEQDLTKLGGREGDTHTCTLTPCTNLSHLNRTSRSSRIGGGESAAAGSRIVVPESRIRREDSEKVSRHRQACIKVRSRPSVKNAKKSATENSFRCMPKCTRFCLFSLPRPSPLLSLV